MHYRHVLMRFRRDVDPEVVAEVFHAQRRFSEIPDVVWVRAGLALTPSGRLPFTHALLVCFADVAARHRYETHPLHQAAQSLIHPLVDDFVLIDSTETEDRRSGDFGRVFGAGPGYVHDRIS